MSLEVHELQGPGGLVDHSWLPPDGFLNSTFAMVPGPLEPGSAYTIRIAGTLDGRALERESGFLTR